MNAVTEPIRKAFVWQVKVYWEDTDAGGVVYHSRYLNFFERARTEWLRSRGIQQSKMAREDGVIFTIRHMEIDWLQAARLDDELDISVHSVTAGASRLHFVQEMSRAGDRVLLATAEVTAACLDAATFKPVRIPGWISSEIKNAE